MIENIKHLYVQTEDKTAALNELSKEFKISPGSISSNWLSRGWIPKEKQGRVVEILQNIVAQQNQRNAS